MVYWVGITLFVGTRAGHWLCPCREESPIGANPNIYSEALELVCGSSSIGCVLVERKAQHRGKQENPITEPVWISCLCSTSVQSWVKWLETICSSNFPLYWDLPLYEVHQIRRADTGEPTLLE